MRYILLLTLLLAPVACIKPDIKGLALICGSAQATPLLDTVVSILLKGGDGYKDALDTLAKQQGPELVACLVREAMKWFSAHGAQREAMGYQADYAMIEAYVRGEEYLQ